MQELQVNVKQAEVEIIDREVFEQGINDVVAKYQNYTVTASTIKGDKKVLESTCRLTGRHVKNFSGHKPYSLTI